MLVYYILLIAERFHDWGHLSGGVVDLSFVPITPVKVVGALAVITALILPRQPDAADRRANPVVFLFSIFACYPLLMTWTLGRALPASALASLISLLALVPRDQSAGFHGSVAAEFHPSFSVGIGILDALVLQANAGRSRPGLGCWSGSKLRRNEPHRRDSTRDVDGAI